MARLRTFVCKCVRVIVHARVKVIRSTRHQVQPRCSQVLSDVQRKHSVPERDVGFGFVFLHWLVGCVSGSLERVKLRLRFVGLEVCLCFAPLVDKVLDVVGLFNFARISVFDKHGALDVFVRAHVVGVEVYK